MSTALLARRPDPGTPVTLEMTDRPVDRSSSARPLPNADRIVPDLRLIGFMVRQ
jgi:hypothetical protein